MAAYPRHGVKKVESMFAYDVIDGVKGPLNRLSDAFIAMMLSPLPRRDAGVARLGGITGVSPSTLRRFLVEGTNLSDELLTSIEAFVTGWRDVLGAPRFLFAGGTPGICGRLGCVKSSITVVGFSHPSFTSPQCVAREEVVTAVCDEHYRAFFGKPAPTKYQQWKAGNVTLEAQVVTLEEEKCSLEAEARSVEEAARSLEAQVATLKAQVVTLKEEKRSVETQVVTLTTDLATSRARVAELEQANRTRQRQRRQRRRARENADWAREQAEMKEAWDAEQASADAEQVARLARLVAAEREATRAANVQTQYFVKLDETHSEETLRVLEEYSDELAGLHL